MTEALVALVGVLMGAVVSIVGQRINGDRADERARAENWRQARLAAISQFAASANSYRRAVMSRHLPNVRGERPSADPAQSHVWDAKNAAAVDDVRLSRAKAWEAYYHLRLLSPVDSWVEQAKTVLGEIKSLRDSEDAQSLDDAAEVVRHKIDGLIDDAKQFVD